MNPLDYEQKYAAVEDFLGEFCHEVRGGGSNIYVSCPFAPYSAGHKNAMDNKPSMGILVRENEGCLVHCFACEESASSLVTLCQKLAIHNPEMFYPLIQRASEIEYVDVEAVVSDVPEYAGRGERLAARAHIHIFDETTYEPFSRRWHPYLAERGLTKDTAKRWESGYDHKFKRVTFPIRDFDGHLCGVVGRGIHNQRPKYMQYTDFDAQNFLFGAQLVRPNTVVVVVEGIFDAIVADQILRAHSDHYSVVAVMGSHMSRVQASQIVHCAVEVVLAFDPDQAGQEATSLATSLLGDRVCVKFLQWPSEEMDPATCPQFAQLVETASFFPSNFLALPPL